MAECNSNDFTECNSVECNLDNQQFRLNKINEIKNYLIAVIKERELTSKKLSKYIASFDYFDKSLFYQQQVVAFLLHHLQQLLNTCRNSKYKFCSYIFIVYRTCKRIIKNKKK